MYMYVCIHAYIHTCTQDYIINLYTHTSYIAQPQLNTYTYLYAYIYTHTQHAYSVIPKAPRGYFASGARGELSAAVRRDALPAAKEDSLVLSREWGN